jgi:predicted dehydrogenase
MNRKINEVNSRKDSRRDFIKKSATGAAALSIGGVLPGFNAKSYGSIIGANEKVLVAVMGVNSRGLALSTYYAKQPDSEVVYICDVDSRAIEKCINTVEPLQNKRPKGLPDFRKALEDKQIDALVIASPDHWHAPAAILASKAGKNVYVEKPCSHNPHEGELLTKVQEKYKNVIQMGSQRRSFPNVIAAIEELRNGAIGRPYFAKGWYSDSRGTIGHGKPAEVPSWLNYDLWQGPAPRKPFIDNLVHYNWHWRWHWGTGEALNNGTHMVDLMRWGLDVDFPITVASTGGRYCFEDDWETPDTQVISIDFPNRTTMVWEGRSCNPQWEEGMYVGVMFYGEKGSLGIFDNSYKIFDMKNKAIKEVKAEMQANEANHTSPSANLDPLHIQNFINAIKKGEKLHSEIHDGHKSTLLCQLGNISLRSGKTLHVDPKNGHILNDKDAEKFWKREYEKGWEPTL